MVLKPETLRSSSVRGKYVKGFHKAKIEHSGHERGPINFQETHCPSVPVPTASEGLSRHTYPLTSLAQEIPSVKVLVFSDSQSQVTQLDLPHYAVILLSQNMEAEDASRNKVL